VTGRPPDDTPRTGKERRRRFESETRRRFRAAIRIQADTAAEVRAVLIRARDAIVAELASGTASEFTVFRLQLLQRSIRETLAAVERDGAAALDRGIVASWAAGIDQVDAPLRAAGVNVTPQLAQVDGRVLLAMRSFLTDRMRSVSADMVNKVNGELAQALTGVVTPFQTAQKIASIVGEGGLKRALVITRTEMGRAYSVAAQERMAQATEVVPELQKQWRRSGKLHARFEHQAIDGQVQDVDKPFKLGNGVKLMHPRDPKAPAAETINCGCTALPYMSSWTMLNPGRTPVTDREADGSRQLRLLRDADTPPAF
jgi:hypothetical protein